MEHLKWHFWNHHWIRFITKPIDIANYFNDFFIGKSSQLRHDISATNADTTHLSISDQIMKDKHFNFEFRKGNVEEVKNWLLSINNDKPPLTT